MRHSAHICEELIGQNRDVRLLQTSGGKDVDDLAGSDGLRDDLPDGMVEVIGAAVGWVPLLQGRADPLKKADAIPDGEGVRVRHR